MSNETEIQWVIEGYYVDKHASSRDQKPSEWQRCWKQWILCKTEEEARASLRIGLGYLGKKNQYDLFTNLRLMKYTTVKEVILTGE